MQGMASPPSGQQTSSVAAPAEASDRVLIGLIGLGLMGSAVVQCDDRFTCFASRVLHVGDCGSASKMKLVSNLVLGLNRAVLGSFPAHRSPLRWATALDVMAAGALFTAMGGSDPRVGATCGLIYLLGLIVIGFAPNTTGQDLQE